MPKLIYEYMIVFSHNRGNGRMELFREKKIKDYNDLKSVDKLVSEMTGIDCSVTNFKLLNIKLRKRRFIETVKNQQI